MAPLGAASHRFNSNFNLILVNVNLECSSLTDIILLVSIILIILSREFNFDALLC